MTQQSPQSPPSPIPRYGVHSQAAAAGAPEEAAESLRLVGYAVLDSGVRGRALDMLRSRFDQVRERVAREFGLERLREIDEQHTLRCLLSYDPAFLELACNPPVLAVCRNLIGPGFVLNQQNGVVNPGQGEKYSQGAYHRDLPYQHFVSSRPLGINALFCLDDFTEENGATLVIPASHKLENLPPDAVIRATEQRIVAPAGSFLLLDAMTYHRGSANLTALARRAVNHVYSIGLVRQQIDLPACLGEDFSADPEVRRLLGYDYPSSGSVAEYYAARRAKLRK